MERLSLIKKAIEQTKPFYGNLLEDVEWLIEQAERVHNQAELLRRYRDALKFYADKSNYELSAEAERADLTEFINILDMDNGDKARKALDIEKD